MSKKKGTSSKPELIRVTDSQPELIRIEKLEKQTINVAKLEMIGARPNKRRQGVSPTTSALPLIRQGSNDGSQVAGAKPCDATMGEEGSDRPRSEAVPNTGVQRERRCGGNMILLSKSGDYRIGKTGPRNKHWIDSRRLWYGGIVARPDQSHIDIMPLRLASDGQVSAGRGSF